MLDDANTTLSVESPNSASDASTARFEATAKDVLGKLLNAVGGLLQASPKTISRAVDLHRELGVEASLGWQVFRIAQASDPLATVAYIPGPGLMGKVFRAARTQGFEIHAVEHAEAAYAAFQELVTKQAGDRGTFDTMVASLTHSVSDPHRDAAEQIVLKDRRANFRTSARLWGVQTKVSYSCGVIRPDEDRRQIAVMALIGCVGMRQSRPGPPILIMRTNRVIDRDDEGVFVDEVYAQEPIRMIDEFCTLAGSKTEMVTDPQGERHMLKLPGIGKSSSVDCFAFDITRTKKEEERVQEITSWIRGSTVLVPCELFILDLLVPHGIANPATLSVSTFGNVTDLDISKQSLSACMLPFHENARYLGTDLDDMNDPAVPKCAKIVTSALRRVGWDDKKHDVFRCQVRYPLLHSAIRMEVASLLPDSM